MTKAKTIAIFFLILWQVAIYGQGGYPVQANATVGAPQSIYLSDYYSGASPLLGVNLMLKDSKQESLDVKLRIIITGIDNGVIIRTPDQLQQFSATKLYPYQPLALGGAELAQYFAASALSFAGPIDKQGYLQNGTRIPEGLYMITIEAIEQHRGAIVSNKALITLNLSLNEPPKWASPFVMPDNENFLQPLPSQFIQFRWNVQHRISLAQDTEYDFVIAEAPASQLLTIEDALDPAIPNTFRYKQTVNLPYLTYDASMPLLTPGKKYVCQVTARDTKGRSLFKQDGKSGMLVFIYGKELPKFDADDINIDSENPWGASIGLPEGSGITSITLRYREWDEGTQQYSDWYYKTIEGDSVSLDMLNGGKEYEYEIIPMVGGYPVDTISGSFSQPEPEPRPEIQCGDDYKPMEITNHEPLAVLNPGDKIYVGGFEATVTEAQGSNGQFTGICVVYVSTFGFSVNAEFNGITINTDYVVTRGKVSAIKSPQGTVFDMDGIVSLLDAILKELADIDESNVEKYLDKTEKIIRSCTGKVSLPEEVKRKLTKLEKKFSAFNGELQSGASSVDEAMQKRFEDAYEGIRQQLAKPTINDSEEISDKTGEITFTAYSEQEYGFDNYVKGQRRSQDYIQIQKESGGDPYYVPAKSVSASAEDFVMLDISGQGAGLTLDDIQIRKSIGGAVSKTKQGDGLRVSVIGGLDGDKGELTAFATVTEDDIPKEKILGKLNVYTYDTEAQDVYIVQVNNNTINLTKGEIEGGLNEIYKQAVYAFSVEGIITLTDNSISGSNIDVGDTKLYKNYTDDMGAIISAFKNKPGVEIDKDAAYIFVVHSPSDRSTKGFMPLGRQFGFIFLDPISSNKAQFINTLAHELAHGCSKLRHSWEMGAGSQNGTDNLMDYKGGTDLYVYQWQNIHDPVGGLGWFQDVEQGKSQEGSGTIHDHLKKRLAALKQQKGMEFIAILHCETCQEPDGSSQNLEDDKFISSNFINFGQSLNFEGKSLPVISYTSGGDSKNIQAQSGELFLGNAKSCFALYFGKTNDLTMEGQQNEEGLPNMPAPALYVTDENFLDNILYDCTSELGDWSNVICEEKILSEETAGQVTAKYLDDLISYVETCIQNTSPGSTPARIHYYTDQRFKDENAINQLISGLTTYTDQYGEKRHDTKAQVFVSSGTLRQEQIDEINNYALSAGEHKIWLHKNIEGHWELKSMELNNAFDEINEELSSDISFEDFIAGMQVGLDNSLETLDIVTTGIYEGLDWLAKGVRYAKIPESVFNCNKESEYKPEYAAFYSYAISQIMPIQVIIREVLISSISKDVTDQTIKNCLNSISQGQVEFAFYCGLWNGLVEIVGSVPDLLKLVVTPFSSKGRQEFSTFIDGLSQFKKENEATGEIECSGSWCAIKTSLGEQFDPGKCCQFAELLGEIAGPIIISFIAPQIAGTAVKSAGGKVIMNIIKCLQWCDKIGDPFRYASISFRYIKPGLSYLRTQSKRLLVKIENEIFKGAILMGDAIHEISKPLDEVAVSIAEPGGQKFRATFTEGNISKGGLLLDNDLVKLLEKRGVQLSKLGKLLKQAGDENQILNKLSKTNLENDNLIKFIDDLIASPELLSHFKGKSVLGSELLDLGNAWRIIKEAKTTGAPILRKNIDNLTNLTAISKKLSNKITPDELLNAVKQLANNTNPPVLGEGLRILSRLKEKTGVEHLIKDLGIGKGKYKGASWVMRYVDGKGDDFINAIQEFELKDLYAGGTKGRIYDIALTGGKRFELKSWDDWYPSSIQKQFIDDLANPNIKNLEDLFWVFEKSNAIPDVTTLKGKVISVLKDNKKLLEKVPLDKGQKWTDDLFLDETEKVDALIKMLDKTNNFKKVFKVVL